MLISLLLQNFYHVYCWQCFDMKYRKSTLPCFAMVSIRKSILTLSTLGTRIELYSGVPLLGYTYSSTRVFQCIHVPNKKEIKLMFQKYQASSLPLLSIQFTHLSVLLMYSNPSLCLQTKTYRIIESQNPSSCI